MATMASFPRSVPVLILVFFLYGLTSCVSTEYVRASRVNLNRPSLLGNGDLILGAYDRVVLMSKDGTIVKIAWPNPSYVGAFSSDGRELVYAASDNPGDSGARALNFDERYDKLLVSNLHNRSNEPKVILDGTYCTFPCFSADSRSVYFVASTETRATIDKRIQNFRGSPESTTTDIDAYFGTIAPHFDLYECEVDSDSIQRLSSGEFYSIRKLAIDKQHGSLYFLAVDSHWRESIHRFSLLSRRDEVVYQISQTGSPFQTRLNFDLLPNTNKLIIAQLSGNQLGSGLIIEKDLTSDVESKIGVIPQQLSVQGFLADITVDPDERFLFALVEPDSEGHAAYSKLFRLEIASSRWEELKLELPAK